ncbi:MAG: thiosulfate/3-mercaptopyruvate sulfurtransferase [Streptosporangiaceae bacterium]|nr:thiosulfate/3-mercaptopyruvate sulfurtransferase [Streptosporangiaceae bacterium]
MDSTLDAAALASALATGPAPVLLDIRWRLGGPPGVERYREGHLPGARFVDLDRDLAGPPGAGGRHPRPDTAAFEAAMRRAGVSDDRPVVVYDENDSTAAARAWWLLRYFGHPQVQVLDGGYQTWLAADQPIETGPAPVPAAGTFTARPGHLPLLDADGAARMARDGVLLDARAAERYRGEVEPADPVAGHIPAAVSAPTTGNLGPEGRFLDPEALRDRFTRLGAGDAEHGGPRGAITTGVYCGSGVTAAHEVLALTIAGIPAALYLGSWSDWITDPARPIATGPVPA